MARYVAYCKLAGLNFVLKLLQQSSLLSPSDRSCVEFFTLSLYGRKSKKTGH